MKEDELWKIALGEIELSVSKASFTTWFKNTSIYKIEEGEVKIIVPNIFAKEWLEKKYKGIILETLRRHEPNINKLSCFLNTELSQVKNKKSVDSVVTNTGNHPVNLSTGYKQKNTLGKQQGDKNQKIESNHFLNNNQNFYSNLNPKYHFDSYVVGSNNDLAYAACKSVAENPGTEYNPLFIYGGVGLGKTHLLQATGNHIARESKKNKVKYIGMERFANELISAIQSSKAKEFKDEYIRLDVLIIDDAQFLSGKEKTQEEFFHVFESLYQHGKQIIISSDRPPKSIPTLEDRLRSRFEGGMMADINKPDIETRLAIIKRKTQEKKIQLDEEIINYLAENIYHNIRELEGALNKIIVTYQLRNKEPTLKEVMEITEDLISTNRQKNLDKDKIIKAVAEFFDIKPTDIYEKGRKKQSIRPRQVAIYLLRKDLNLSFPEVGKNIGGRDHSTAMYANKKIEKELSSNKILKDQIKFIREKYIDY
jgi:chromosomal replication initiator protein